MGGGGGVGSVIGSFPFLFVVGLNLGLGLKIIFFLRVIFYLAFEGLAIIDSSGWAAYLIFYLTFLEGLAIILKISISYKVRFFLRGRIEVRCRVIDRSLLKLGIT